MEEKMNDIEFEKNINKEEHVFKIVSITPQLAKYLLEKNIHNRKLSESTVRCYAKAMREGDWTWNSQPISFSKKGILTNGQHRLTAIVQSGITVDMVIEFNSPDGALHDIGKNRTISNVMELNGVIPKEFCVSPYKGIAELAISPRDKRKMQAAEIERYISSNIDLMWELKDILNTKHEKYFNQAPIKAAIYFALKAGVDREKLGSFFRMLNSGIFTSSERGTISIMKLRNWIIKNPKFPGLDNRVEYIKVIIRVQYAIRNYSEGKNVKNDKIPQEVIYPIE
jgi:hypothetical protein